VVRKAFWSSYRGVTQDPFLIIWVQRGWQDYEVEGEWRRVRGGEVLLVPPGGRINYQGRPTTRILSYELFVALHHRRAFLGHKSLDPLRRRLGKIAFTHTVAPEGLGVWMKRLFEEPKNRDALQPARVLTYLLNALWLAASATEPGYQRRHALPEQVRVGIAYMRENLDKPITLADLARHTGYARSTLIEAFGKHVGVTPIEHLMELRVQRAAELLAQGDEGVTQIAMRTGFATSQHFATVFRKYMLMTPSVFRGESKGSKMGL
jgi:AraC-like DNA-binding protein